MGSWFKTCAVSNLYIMDYTPVVCFLITENPYKDDHVYINTYNNLCPLPFYGKYADYGRADECKGLALPILLKALKSKVTDLDQGENKYHDVPVKANDLTIESLWDICNEERLFIEGNSDFKYIENYLIPLFKAGQPVDKVKIYERLKSTRTLGLKTSLIMIREDIFNHVLNSWVQEEYIGYNDKTKKYEYKYFKFKDIVKSLDVYIDALMDRVKHLRTIFNKNEYQYLINPTNIIKWEDRHSCKAFNYFRSFTGESSNFNSIVNIEQLIVDTADKSPKKLKPLLTEYLKGAYINRFMSSIRKPWIKQIGEGSQQCDSAPYRVLNSAIQKALVKEDREAEE